MNAKLMPCGIEMMSESVFFVDSIFFMSNIKLSQLEIKGRYLFIIEV